MTVTFVTYLDVNDTSKIAIRDTLLLCGIPLCIYISRELPEDAKWIEKLSNVWIRHISDVDVRISFTPPCNTEEYELPINRCHTKDTAEYLKQTNLYQEWMHDATTINPWNTTHFAWIDIHIFEIFHKPLESIHWLKLLSSLNLADQFMVIPGCWDKIHMENDIDGFINNVWWRFCGKFYIGDQKSILAFCDLCRTHFPKFMQTYNHLTWEVNYWAYLESTVQEEWFPIWYRANHNDNILQFSADYYAEYINPELAIRYHYPYIPDYYPTSASVILHDGKYIMNTRYVNYWILPNGCYHINSHDGNTIRNQNIISILEPEGDALIPISYNQIESKIGLPDFLCKATNFVSEGLEDVRLYEFDGRLKFIATTIQYSPMGQNRMILGEYNIDENRIHSANLIEPPNADTWCEKNWIPISHSPNWSDEEHFIYSWSPFIVGKINDETTMEHFHSKLNIVLKRDYVNVPFLDRIRGSTIFLPYNENRLIGVVHFSEEYLPRHYYHMLLQLDRNSLEILEYSQPFYFQQLSIEFCIGFLSLENKFLFWISQMDRDPLHLVIPQERFSWTKV